MVWRAARALVAIAVMGGLLFAAPAGAFERAPEPPVVATCAVSATAGGFDVVWGALGEAGDRFVIERSVDGEVFHWRGVTDRSERSFFDPDSDFVGATAAYRLVLKDDQRVLGTTDCSAGRGVSGQLECSVSVSPSGYSVAWAKGPTGEGLDYIVERDVNTDDVFHWRGRTVDRRFDDAGSRLLPVYRVTARFDGDPVQSAECELEVGAVRAVDAEFVCPAPTATFIDTFGADRDGGARRHQGVDMFAPVGTPVLAPEDGRVFLITNRLGGIAFGLYGASGTFYYGAHLDRFEGADRSVRAGEIVGTIGNTGNAATTPPHLHFQIHPDGRGTAPINPTAPTAIACR